MKSLVLATLLLFSAPNKPLTDMHIGQLRLSNAHGFAHGCPIAADVVLTNAHVVKEGQWREYRYEGIDGMKGRVKATDGLQIADLAIMTPTPLLKNWYEVALKCPLPGEKVYHLGYERSDRKKLHRPISVEAEVISIQAGEIVYSESGGPGSSGSCLLNSDGKVVGLNEGALIDEIYMPDGRKVFNVLGGLGAAICGEWYKEVEELRGKK